ncbi:putative membrane protein [Variovorax boronicumulans]|uniref:anthrone oxygenase family protein n=1 Tax=Variovorax TaxID=34072 RepID=UPI0027825BD5|nr:MULTISPECIES: anthrone oxygenase family protein [Variovorax]MDQ0038366.1 putative membrane protein [Variovorax boronicumulans]MDQ0608544.1 putative membrane protein [Variovorax sp. W1I1]
MMGKTATVLILVSAFSIAMVAGIFYAFSSFVMPALARIQNSEGIHAMNSINLTVITPSFMLLFMGSAVLGVVLGGWSLFSISQLDSQLVLLASLLYVVGCFGVTMVLNVPLNNQLAATSPTGGHVFWQTYLKTWTLWNSVRTASSALAAIVFIAAALKRAAA